ncbi:hypothetical protein BWQ96_07282 [Gracilariopsis chorda]|uniref:Uncharacterized protein n=1 Tax=Gracilariopsis chorda TaxID=448386 RepID=A0A2V3ILP6_9FLOR|nr:hypothetical protein BWQ96_07282 [Gracilariopsis chorda]|eukprot:PXF42978.1 hypothetical protein BWQ96_07282 [Gracilariopsis chorda]
MSNPFTDEIVEALRITRDQDGSRFLFIPLSNINSNILQDIKLHPDIELVIDDDQETACLSYGDRYIPVTSYIVPQTTAVFPGECSGARFGKLRGEERVHKINLLKKHAQDASRDSILISGTTPAETGFETSLFELMASMRAQTFPVEATDMLGMRITFETLRFRAKTQNQSAMRSNHILESVQFGIRPVFPTKHCTCVDVKPMPVRRCIGFVKKGLGGGVAATAFGASLNLESRWESSQERFDYKVEAVCGSESLATDAEWLWRLETWNDGSAYRALDTGLTVAELKGWVSGRRPSCSSFLAERGSLSAEWVLPKGENGSSTTLCFELYASPHFVQLRMTRELQTKLKIKSRQVDERRLSPRVFNKHFYFSDTSQSCVASELSTKDVGLSQNPDSSVVDNAIKQTNQESVPEKPAPSETDSDNDWSELKV